MKSRERTWRCQHSGISDAVPAQVLKWKIPRNLLGCLGVHGAFAMLNSVTPFFIVDDLGATLAFYQSKLGFDVRHKGGGDGNTDDFWAILGRDRVMLMFKAITPEVHPQPNRSRHEWARWDAYIYTDDPDSLYAEFVGKGVPVHRELANTSDGLRAFEITDNNGYLLCFGRPLDK
jgi:catechol 2,3-dioxygenase-like lactoylglutathione lyase family enzyme